MNDFPTLPHGFASWWRRVVFCALATWPWLVLSVWVVDLIGSAPDPGLLVAVVIPQLIIWPWLAEVQNRQPLSARQRCVARGVVVGVALALVWPVIAGPEGYRWSGATGIVACALVLLGPSSLRSWGRA